MASRTASLNLPQEEQPPGIHKGTDEEADPEAWSSPLSEEGRMERRTVVLRAAGLEIRDAQGRCLRSIERQSVAGAVVRETGGGAWLELELTDGGVVRAAMSALAGASGLQAFRDKVERWASQTNEGFREKANGESTQEGTETKLTWRRRLKALSGLLGYAVPHRKAILFSCAVLLVGVGFEALPPYLMKLMVDEGILQGSVTRFVGLIALLLSVYFLQAGFQVLRTSITIRIGNRMMSRIRKDMFDKLMKLSVRYYENRATAPFIGRIQYDTSWVQGFLSEGIPQLAAQTVMACAIFAILFAIDWRLTLGVAALLPICALLVLWLWPRMRSRMNRTWNTQYWLQKYIGEALQGIRVIKAFRREDEEKRRFSQFNEEAVRRAIDQQRMLQWLQPGMNLAISAGIALVWLIGGQYAIRGSSSLGTLIAFTTYLSMFLGQLRWNMNLASQANASIAAADRIFDLLGTDDELQVEGEAVRMPAAKGEIAFEEVTFGYEKGREVLRDFSLRIRPGEKIGITGHTGAGKSTLLQLLGRFYDPDAGAVRLDGVDLKRIDPADLRKSIGIVFQDTFLFDGTIAENIAYGVADASPERIMEAARLARAHSFIERLPFGYDTRVGERGVRLSGGEKQRISIARTLLLNPAILLLDEATSSVDQETERDIQEALDVLSAGRTTIAIAHRLSTLRNSDRIVVLEQGRLAEIGTHEELVRRGGIYLKLLEARRELPRQAATAG
ncbi:ABC transporter ATP-binding protein [Cohnella sp. AR92]|uniref:ABC transporter ATP-binding protein n=1 Tax=Cohnella sp. AR92 TaxID=648716 RepID=UPI00131526B0|nr:ABC transporter ATP-binding protein [Cohnella sp. AR92]